MKCFSVSRGVVTVRSGVTTMYPRDSVKSYIIIIVIFFIFYFIRREQTPFTKYVGTQNNCD